MKGSFSGTHTALAMPDERSRDARKKQTIFFIISPLFVIWPKFSFLFCFYYSKIARFCQPAFNDFALHGLNGLYLCILEQKFLLSIFVTSPAGSCSFPDFPWSNFPCKAALSLQVFFHNPAKRLVLQDFFRQPYEIKKLPDFLFTNIFNCAIVKPSARQGPPARPNMTC